MPLNGRMADCTPRHTQYIIEPMYTNTLPTLRIEIYIHKIGRVVNLGASCHRMAKLASKTCCIRINDNIWFNYANVPMNANECVHRREANANAIEYIDMQFSAWRIIKYYARTTARR